MKKKSKTKTKAGIKVSATMLLRQSDWNEQNTCCKTKEEILVSNWVTVSIEMVQPVTRGVLCETVSSPGDAMIEITTFN